jgi:hypothetical protein
VSITCTRTCILMHDAWSGWLCLINDAYAGARGLRLLVRDQPWDR